MLHGGEGNATGDKQSHDAKQPVGGEADVAHAGPERVDDELCQLIFRKGVRVTGKEENKNNEVSVTHMFADC